MLIVKDIIAKKYALAFLHVYKAECDNLYIEKLAIFTKFISSSKIFQAILSRPSLPITKKKQIVELMAEKLGLRPCTKKLVLLLLKEKRIELLVDICKKILLLYKKQQNVEHFEITSSHKLLTEEEKIITEFIASQVSIKINANFTVDTSLISGIKIKSDTFIWERSINKQLQKIEQKLLRREELW